jgi:acetate kinase
MAPHLGGQERKSLDTSMGFTPLQGLVMGTVAGHRPGDTGVSDEKMNLSPMNRQLSEQKIRGTRPVRIVERFP